MRNVRPGDVWILCFLSLITLNWWVSCMLQLFEWVFIFYFYHSKLTKLSYELVRMRKKKKFWVMKIELWWHFRNFAQLIGPTFCVLSNPCKLTWLPNGSLLSHHTWLFFALFLWFSVFLPSHSSSLFFLHVRSGLGFSNFFSLFSFPFTLGFWVWFLFSLFLSPFH